MLYVNVGAGRWLSCLEFGFGFGKSVSHRIHPPSPPPPPPPTTLELVVRTNPNVWIHSRCRCRSEVYCISIHKTYACTHTHTRPPPPPLPPMPRQNDRPADRHHEWAWLAKMCFRVESELCIHISLCIWRQQQAFMDSSLTVYEHICIPSPPYIRGRCRR